MRVVCRDQVLGRHIGTPGGLGQFPIAGDDLEEVGARSGATRT